MNAKTFFLIAINFLVLDVFLIFATLETGNTPSSLPPIIEHPIQEEQERPVSPEISVTIPGWLNYRNTLEQMNIWQQEAPGLTEIGQYGETSLGTPLYYIKLGKHNLCAMGERKRDRILIFASIHGNEPWASSITMGYIGLMLDQYGEDDRVTKLIETKDIYFIPVVSPDTFPRDENGSGMKRYVEGVDPNRDFPTLRDPNKESVSPVRALQELHNSVGGFDAIISGHTWGQLFLKPWGDSKKPCSNDSEYNEILAKMKSLSQYKAMAASGIYGRPIYGTEVDWFYRHGAFSIVIEYGTHQRVPTKSQVEGECQKTYGAVLHFLEKAPDVSIRSSTNL